ELAAGEIVPWLRQQDCDLQRENVVAVDVLMQAVEVTRLVSEDERRRPRLSGAMASIEKGVEPWRETRRQPPCLLPAIGDIGQRRVQQRAQGRDRRWQGIG